MKDGRSRIIQSDVPDYTSAESQACQGAYSSGRGVQLGIMTFWLLAMGHYVKGGLT